MTGPDKTSVSELARPAQAMFLERQSYRRRRLLDMARLLPLLGVLLLLVPLLWPGAEQNAGVNDSVPPTPMSYAITYVFAVWAALIFGAVVFGIAARRWGRGGGKAGQRPDPGRD